MALKRYAQLNRLSTIEQRFRYLELHGHVGEATFGFDRWMNQKFYQSREWKQTRNAIIVRDDGCDMGVEGFDIRGVILIHHMNPLTSEHIKRGDVNAMLDPEQLISVSHQTHNAIHYGDEKLLPRLFVPRERGDTKLW